jgi:hypothetical protein|tara:strand:+ start:399 stop:1769 length:1371 start_codon:yes stop_codon:yes gene_type:complete
MANTSISRDISSTSTPKKLTCSFWVKRTNLGSTQRIFSQSNDSNDRMYWRFEAGSPVDRFTAWNEAGGSVFSSITTNNQFRDCNGWYHIVLRWDTTQSTSTDRLRMYVNGTNIDDLGGYASYTAPAQDATFGSFSSTSCKFDIGYYRGANNEHFDGYLSHIHLCDGYSYAPTEFGSTDSTTGSWSINPSPNVSYGTNGFWLFKDDNALTDASAGSNNFTSVGGNLTLSQDNPSNVFCIPNRNHRENTNLTFSGAGQRLECASGVNWLGNAGTIGVKKGKWYWEVKNIGGGNFGAGVGKEALGTSTYYFRSANNWLYDQTTNYGFYRNGGNPYKGNSGTTPAYGSDIAHNDILMVAFDADNGKIYLGKNGTWFDSGNPATNTNPAYTFTMTGTTSVTDKYWFPIYVVEQNEIEVNHGNGIWEGSAIGSPNADGQGLGKFQYTPPSGYLALCTKNLNV